MKNTTQPNPTVVDDHRQKYTFMIILSISTIWYTLNEKASIPQSLQHRHFIYQFASPSILLPSKLGLVERGSPPKNLLILVLSPLNRHFSFCHRFSAFFFEFCFLHFLLKQKSSSHSLFCTINLVPVLVEFLLCSLF